MSSPSSQPQPSTQLENQQQSQPITSTTTTTDPPPPLTSPNHFSYILFKRCTAYTFLLASPILVALPPRKLDLHTAALTIAFLVSANHVSREQSHSGRSITDRLTGFVTSPPSVSMPSAPRVFSGLPSERAEEVHRALKEQRRQQQQQQQERPDEAEDNDGSKERSRGIDGIARGMWMGGETEGWRQQRAEEEKKALEEGKGYGSLIMQHIREAWGVDDTSGRRKEEGAGEKKGEGESDGKEEKKE